MSINHSRILWSVLMAGTLAVTGCQNGDGTKAPGGRVGVNSQAQINPDLEPTMNAAEGQLQFLEQTAQEILNTHIMTSSQETALEQTMLDYGTAMKHGFDLAADDATLASNSEGVDGSGESIGIYENFAGGHVPRTDTFANNMELISQGLDNGTITREEMGLQLPAPGPKDAKFASLRKARGTGGGTLSRFFGKVTRSVNDVLFPPANAMIAIPCISPCQNQNWGQCVGCILAAVPQAIQAWNTFTSCWNSCGECNWKKWRTWGCCYTKARCLATLIQKLA